MKYLHILLSCAAEPWALQREKLDAIAHFLLFKADGGMLSESEVQARISKKQEADVQRAPGSVIVLPIHGLLMPRVSMMESISEGGQSIAEIGRAFRSMLADDKVKTIILDIDSPGGTVSGTEELSREIYDSRGVKPIIAQVNATAASAAYWIATAADEIVVTPSGQAGSVGVYSVHDDISERLKAEGIKKTLVASSPQKSEGNPYEPLSEEARAFMEQRVNECNAMFVDAVARNRGIATADVTERFGQGRTFGAKELMKRKMADRIATLPDTLNRFGITLNPTATRARVEQSSQRASSLVLIEKLRAGDQPSVREWENGLKGLAGLSNSEAERAVRACFKVAPGEPEIATDNPAARQKIAEIRAQLDAFVLPTIGD